MKIAKKNLADIWENMKWDEKSSDEMSWDEVQVWSVECGEWRVQCEVWGKCLLDVALHRGRAQVMFLGDNNNNHNDNDNANDNDNDNNNCSWSCSWSVKCGAWSVKCGVWRVQWEVWSALVIFLLKVLFKSVSKSSFFRFGVEIRFWSCNSYCHYIQERFSVRFFL